MSELINSPGLAAPVGFSHAVGRRHRVPRRPDRADPDGAIVGDTIAEQFDQAAGNLVTALRAAGGEPDDLVSLQVFVTSVAEYKAALPELGRVWRRHFGRRYPAMGLFGVTELFDPAAKVELMGVAVLPPADAAMSSARDRHLSEAQLELYERTRRLAVTTLKPIADAGTPGGVNRPLIKALAEHGLLDGCSRRRAISAIELCLIREALARQHRRRDRVRASGARRGPDRPGRRRHEIKHEWIPQVAAGTAVAAFALTEPEAGSDPAALSLKAEPDRDGGYRLTGEKLWISNAPEADIYTVFARTGAATGARGLTAFAIPGDAPGLSGEREELLAPHAIGSLTFDGVYAATRPGARRAGRRLPRGDAHARPVPPQRRRVRDRDGPRGA